MAYQGGRIKSYHPIGSSSLCAKTVLPWQVWGKLPNCQPHHHPGASNISSHARRTQNLYVPRGQLLEDPLMQSKSIDEGREGLGPQQGAPLRGWWQGPSCAATSWIRTDTPGMRNRGSWGKVSAEILHWEGYVLTTLGGRGGLTHNPVCVCQGGSNIELSSI